MSNNMSVARNYSPYGQQDNEASQASMLGFKGEQVDGHSGTYLLGNGYRAYSPTLMRFLAPDSWSPFGVGGRNAYCYCSGNPVAGLHPSGHADLSQLRKVPQKLLAESRAEQSRQAQQQTAQQRVEALRARLRARQQTTPDAQAMRNPMAQPGTPYLTHRAPTAHPSQQTSQINGDQATLRHEVNAAQPLNLGQVESLYQQLIDINQHEQNYSRSVSYLAEGTELRQEYERDMSRIRTQADQIRSQLGVDALRWFHF